MHTGNSRIALDRSLLERGAAQQRSVFVRSHQRRGTAFSLIEVIAAVAIFAVGMVAVLALFAPVTKSVAGVSEAESAARVADALRARLQALPFETALALIQDPAAVQKNDGDGTYNPNAGAKNPAVIFGKRSGDVGIYDASEGRNNWYDSSIPPAVVPNADKYFEIDLIRNETLSPKENDATAPVIAFNVRVRWPAFMAASSGAAVQVGANPGGGGPVPFDHSKKQVMFFTGTIAR
jgi:type II secretory pathway pseudopilin PulG